MDAEAQGATAEAASSLPRPEPEALRSWGRTLPPRSAEIDALGRLPDDIVDGLIDTGVFRMFIPSEYHGHEMPLSEALAAIEELSYWDSAVGWCTMIGATTALQSAYLPPEHAEPIYRDDPRAVTGGVAEPRGRVATADGGLVANGRWAWGSGAHHCTYVGGGCLLPTGEDRPKLLFVFFERSQIQQHDNWHVMGLRGSGSADFEVTDAFVPEGRWVERLFSTPRFDGPLYRLPHFGLLALGVSVVGLGIARRALDEVRELATAKSYVGSRRTLSQRQAVQASVARAEAEIRSARAFVDEAVGKAWASACDGEMGVEERRLLRLAATHAMTCSVRATDAAHEVAGGTAVYEASPLARLFRDVHAAASHGMVAARTYELSGRLALGLETDIAML